MATTYELSIAIPAYNERRNLPDLIKAYRGLKNGIRFQMVIVDNGSSDGTAEYLKDVLKKKENSWIKVVTVKKNIGYGYGLYQGLLGCDADAIGWSHADLQNPPEDVFKAYALYRQHGGKAFVKGHRVGRHWKPTLFSNGLGLVAQAILMRRLDDINGQPKVFNRELLATFQEPPHGFTFDLYVQYKAVQNGYKVVPFYVEFLRRLHGESKGGEVNLWKKLPIIKAYLVGAAKMRLGMTR